VEGIYSWELMMNKKKSCEQANIEGNLRREMKKDLRNVEFWVKHFNIYN
jgi:hypothetical protein